MGLFNGNSPDVECHGHKSASEFTKQPSKFLTYNNLLK